MSVERQIAPLTGLRFLAAASVAVAHGTSLILRFDQSQFGTSFWLRQGTAFGMTLFFVLSGFVIHYNYRSLVTRDGFRGIGTFVWARFARLYPLYLFVILIDVLFGRELFNFMEGGPSFEATMHALPFYLTLTQSWLYRVIGDHSLIYAFGVNSSLTWSISTEWFFYFAYIFLAPLIVLIRRPAPLVAVTASWCIVWWILQVSARASFPSIDSWAVATYGHVAGYSHGSANSFFLWLSYFSPYSRIGEFILGALTAQLYLQLRDRKVSPSEEWAGNAALAIAAAVLVGLIYGRNFSPILMKYLVPDFGPAPAIAIIMFCASRYRSVAARFLSCRPILALGEASYSIYLIHFLIFYLPFGYHQPPLLPTPFNIIFLTVRYITAFALVLLLSLGLHAYFEVPARLWLRNLWTRFRESGFRTAYGLFPAALFLAPGVFAFLFLQFGERPAIANRSSAGISVISASYGQNCGALPGNATDRLRAACDGRPSCRYRVEAGIIGDPVARCPKEFVVEYTCPSGAAPLHARVAPEAGLGSTVNLDCAVAGSETTPLGTAH